MNRKNKLSHEKITRGLKELDEIVKQNEPHMRRVCKEHGLDFDTMSEDERMDFVCELVRSVRRKET